MSDTVESLQRGARPTILFSTTESDVEFILGPQPLQRRILSDPGAAPPEVEDYASALLWKHLRELCDGEVAGAEIEEVKVILRAPTIAA